MLQLGLSPEAYKNINVPILKLLTRNSDWAIWGDKATGTSKGTNTPQVNPIVDLVGTADGTLTGFAFTPASGYVDVVAPNGKTVTGIQGDGVNDVIVLPNNPSIDITGTGDFAIGVVFKTGETLNGGSAIFATGDGVAVPQILLQTYANSYIAGRVGGNFYIFAGAGTLAINTFYQAILYRKSGVLKLRLQKVVVYSENNVIPITSTSIKRIGAIPTNAGGTTHSDFFNLWLGTIKITNGAITPFTEEELIKDWDSFCSKVYGL